MLEIGIFASHLVWLVRTRKIRKAAMAEGKTFDDIAAEHEASGIPFRFAERKSQTRKRQELDSNNEGSGDTREKEEEMPPTSAA